MFKPKYFSEEEFNRVGCSLSDMDDDLLCRLDSLRERCSFPLKITSAYRSVELEKERGRSGFSLHCKGLAVDISCVNSAIRYVIVKNAFDLGFTGIGIGENFIHLDIRPDSYPFMFHYY